MERKTPEGIILQKGESLHKNRKYMFRWTDVSGKRRAVYADTIVQLRYIEHQLFLTKELVADIDPTVLTINELYIMWKSIKVGIRKTTLSNYTYLYDSYIRKGFGKRRAISIRKSDVRQLYASILFDRDIKRTTLNSVHNVLYQVLQFGCDEGIIFRNPAEGGYREFCHIRRLDDVRKTELTSYQERIFLGLLRENPKWRRMYPFFVVLAGTGMRISEIGALRWNYVDFEDNELTVSHALGYDREPRNYKLTIHPPKIESGYRRIPMIKSVREALLEEKREQLWRGQKDKYSIDGYSDFVFISREGTLRNQVHINRFIKRVCTEYNNEILQSRGAESEKLPYFTCHTFRASFVTRLCESGINIKMIQNILGHSDVNTTMNVYVAVTTHMRGEAKQRMEEYLETSIF